MSNREGTLRMQSSGRWAICPPGCDPFEITSGDEFRVEVDGELKLTRMEYRHLRVRSGGANSGARLVNTTVWTDTSCEVVCARPLGQRIEAAPMRKKVAVVDILEAEDHLCATCLFDAIIDLIAIDELVDGMSAHLCP